uniref:NADH-ubiquinone oxidoreductase chain 4 n=1 Tax=Meteorus pulchricornis TaxID=51522 RepID=D8WHE5_9HYME|nr:NADH dehydrogenase subunit 4 [Meteorus pulchricornis]ACY09468.1 NADH dehydrogenase subunit 4 [Meteorus pulchricornis]QHS69748.1 NADH dehydrogenase subunit 4 [Meteorus pulchricornis]WCB99550.1 NADH dehydrogenase subunit 4 [Meteorus pulchricornis]
MMKLFMYSFSLIIMIYIIKMYKMILHNFMFMIIPLILMNFNLNNLFMMKIYYIYAIDNISINLILLNCWIINLSMMANMKLIYKNFYMNFLLIMMSLNLIMILCFSSMNLFMFYIYFESSLIPLMILILGWGMQIERIQASMYMLFYTLFGSLPLFFIFTWLYFNLFNLSMIKMMNESNMFIKFNNQLMFMILYMGFFIKTPMYFVHLWLPKAHVEAPISGSMILAGIMLKIGTYGIYRMIFLFNKLTLNFSIMIISITLWGSIMSSLICLNNNDLKIIVAFSSIVHMNMMMASMLTMSNWSTMGSIWMMIAHGLCSSGMFCLVNFMYERSYTRNIFINKGMINIFPSMSLWWFLICSSNFSAPPSLNLFSEIMLINGLMSWLKINMIYIFFITFYSSCYSIYLFSFTQYSFLYKLMNLKNLTIWEFNLIKLHWLPLNLMFLNLNMF